VAVDYTNFCGDEDAAFPEFAEAPKGLVERKIAEAARQVDREVFGDKADDAIGYLAAHLLSTSPFGQHARLIPKNAKQTRDDALTTYEREYRRLVRSCTSGFRVVGC